MIPLSGGAGCWWLKAVWGSPVGDPHGVACCLCACAYIRVTVTDPVRGRLVTVPSPENLPDAKEQRKPPLSGMLIVSSALRLSTLPPTPTLSSPNAGFLVVVPARQVALPLGVTLKATPVRLRRTVDILGSLPVKLT